MSQYEIAVKIAETYVQALSDNDYAKVMELYAEDATLEDPVGTNVLIGKEAVSTFYYGIGIADLTCRITGTVHYSYHEIIFPFECVSKTPSRTMKIEVIDHFVLDDDNKIVSMRAFWSPETTSVLE